MLTKLYQFKTLIEDRQVHLFFEKSRILIIVFAKTLFLKRLHTACNFTDHIARAHTRTLREGACSVIVVIVYVCNMK